MKKLYEKARENNAQASTVSAPTASNHRKFWIGVKVSNKRGNFQI